jgi:hypothetical protein
MVNIGFPALASGMKIFGISTMLSAENLLIVPPVKAGKLFASIPPLVKSELY